MVWASGPYDIIIIPVLLTASILFGMGMMGLLHFPRKTVSEVSQS